MTTKSEEADIIFIHVPKFNDRYNFREDMMFLNVIPSGVFALADYLERDGTRSRILHLGIEWILRGKFDPSSYIAAHRPKAVAMSLYWHYQSYDVIETAGIIKKNFPGVPIILGGLTAGYFADEILEKYPFIDFVISGDGEIPLQKLMKLIKRHSPGSGHDGGDFVPSIPLDYEDLIKIPNLYFRRGGRIIKSPKKFTISKKIFNMLKYHRFDLLEDFDFYRDEIGVPSIWLKERSVEYNRKRLDRLVSLFFPSVGRGCPNKCTWCAKEKRTGIIFRDPRVVADSIKITRSFGYKNLYFTYDPCPDTYQYYIVLFNILREMNLDMSAYFECWGLPTKKFIKYFKHTFDRCVIALSPESGSESVRKINKGNFYTNDDLERTLQLLSGFDVETDLFFSVGIPGENEALFRETADFIEYLRKTYKNIQEICLFGIEIEPGSPWFECPEKFGIISERKNFVDFYNAHKPGEKGSFNSLGYYIPGYFEDKTKCSDLESFENAIDEQKKSVKGIFQLP